MSDRLPIPEALWARTPPEVQAAILAVVGRLERCIADLEARLGQDSTNSSEPPSSDPLHIKRRPPRAPSGRKRGGQPGHERHARELVPPERLTAAVECRPASCRRCGRALGGDDPAPARHQVAELSEVRPEVVEYRRHRLACPGCGAATRAPCRRASPAAPSGPGCWRRSPC